MSLIGVLGLVVFGAIVGWIAMWLHPGDEKVNGIWVIVLGLVGSLTGGFLNFLLGFSSSVISLSGFVMSVVGAVVCCSLYVRRSYFADLLAKLKDKFGS